MKKLADAYIREVVTRHGVPVSVVSDQDVHFTCILLKGVHEELGTFLHFITTFHPQTDGQTERTILTLENMLRVCVLDFGGGWDTYLPLAEFSYNNNYHASIDRPPLRCSTGVSFGPIFVRARSISESWVA